MYTEQYKFKEITQYSLLYFAKIKFQNSAKSAAFNKTSELIQTPLIFKKLVQTHYLKKCWLVGYFVKKWTKIGCPPLKRS